MAKYLVLITVLFSFIPMSFAGPGVGTGDGYPTGKREKVEIKDLPAREPLDKVVKSAAQNMPFLGYLFTTILEKFDEGKNYKIYRIYGDNPDYYARYSTNPGQWSNAPRTRSPHVPWDGEITIWNNLYDLPEIDLTPGAKSQVKAILHELVHLAITRNNEDKTEKLTEAIFKAFAGNDVDLVAAKEAADLIGLVDDWKLTDARWGSFAGHGCSYDKRNCGDKLPIGMPSNEDYVDLYPPRGSRGLPSGNREHAAIYHYHRSEKAYLDSMGLKNRCDDFKTKTIVLKKKKYKVPVVSSELMEKIKINNNHSYFLKNYRDICLSLYFKNGNLVSLKRLRQVYSHSNTGGAFSHPLFNNDRIGSITLAKLLKVRPKIRLRYKPGLVSGAEMVFPKKNPIDLINENQKDKMISIREMEKIIPGYTKWLKLLESNYAELERLPLYLSGTGIQNVLRGMLSRLVKQKFTVCSNLKSKKCKKRMGFVDYYAKKGKAVCTPEKIDTWQGYTYWKSNCVFKWKSRSWKRLWIAKTVKKKRTLSGSQYTSVPKSKYATDSYHVISPVVMFETTNINK